jgi:D-glycero-beta-D-manno-heptose-7-phosphate kinase
MKPDFSGKDILVVGDFMLDIYSYGSSNQTSPEAPVPIIIEDKINMYPGGAGNVVYNINSLGGKATPLGVIGDDQGGSKIIDFFSKKNINTDSLIVSNKIKTTTKKRIFINNIQKLRIDKDSNIRPRSEIIENILEEADKRISKASLVILSDYNKGVISQKVSKYIIKESKKREIPVIVDPKKNKFNCYSSSTIITPNLNEAKSVSGYNKIKDIVKYFMEEIPRLDVDHILLKTGKDGMVLISNNDSKIFKGIEVKNPDVSGAGDTVISVLSLFYSMGYDISDCVKYANIAAAKVVSKKGTAVLKDFF